MVNAAEAARRAVARAQNRLEREDAKKRKSEEAKAAGLRRHSKSTAQEMLKKCLEAVASASRQRRSETTCTFATSGTWEILKTRREYHAMDKLADLLKKEGFTAKVTSEQSTYDIDKDYPSVTDYYVLATISW